jgi:hypothetical protein
MTHEHWSKLGRTDLITAGKALVEERLNRLGCAVTPPSNPIDGRLEVRTGSGRSLEVFVSTQRVGGYAFWGKKRLQPADHRFAALVLVNDGSEPGLYLVPTEEWLDAARPLTDRDYEGKASEPEYGIEINRASIPSLRRFAWTEAADRNFFA